MLSDIIPLIFSMNYTELKDWIDYVEYHYLSALVSDSEHDKFLKNIRNRRIGQPTGAFSHDAYLTSNPLTMTTPLQADALAAYKQLSQDEQITLLGTPELNRNTAAALAWAFLQSKAPLRKTSQGNIQVKWIPYQYVERDEKGNPVKDADGKPLVKTVHAPYLYLRYWQQHGDNNKLKSRVKSIYIGGDADFQTRVSNFVPGSEGYAYPYRPLAELFYATLQEYGETRSRTIKATGEIQTYKVRPKDDENPIAELEQRIIACINMDEVDNTGKDAIDHEALIKLQSELCLD